MPFSASCERTWCVQCAFSASNVRTRCHYGWSCVFKVPFKDIQCAIMDVVMLCSRCRFRIYKVPLLMELCFVQGAISGYTRCHYGLSRVLFKVPFQDIQGAVSCTKQFYTFYTRCILKNTR